MSNNQKCEESGYDCEYHKEQKLEQDFGLHFIKQACKIRYGNIIQRLEKNMKGENLNNFL